VLDLIANKIRKGDRRPVATIIDDLTPSDITGAYRQAYQRALAVRWQAEGQLKLSALAHAEALKMQADTKKMRAETRYKQEQARKLTAPDTVAIPHVVRP